MNKRIHKDMPNHPSWLMQKRDQHRTVFLSDTFSYRHLMVIFRSIMEGGIQATGTVDAESAYSFIAWFLSFANSMPAHEGLSWLHLELGRKTSGTNGQGLACGDNRFDSIILIYLVITGEGDTAGMQEQYFNQIQRAWFDCSDNRFKNSMYQSLLHVLNKDARAELIQLGKARGIKESATKELLQRLHNRASQEATS